MNCPLCNKILLEIDGEHSTDFICSRRVVFGEKYKSLPHFEWRDDHSYYTVRTPPYILLVRDNSTDVCEFWDAGKYASKSIFTLSSVNKSNIEEFTKNRSTEEIASRIKRLIIFS